MPKPKSLLFQYIAWKFRDGGCTSPAWKCTKSKAEKVEVREAVAAERRAKHFSPLQGWGCIAGTGNHPPAIPPDGARVVPPVGGQWCPGPESNRHGAKLQGILSPWRLPIPPPGQEKLEAGSKMKDSVLPGFARSLHTRQEENPSMSTRQGLRPAGKLPRGTEGGAGKILATRSKNRSTFTDENGRGERQLSHARSQGLARAAEGKA